MDRRASSRVSPTTTISLAPDSLAATVAARPCGPGPTTTAVSPMVTPPTVRSQRTPLPSTAQTSTATSPGSSSEMRCTRAVGGR